MPGVAPQSQNAAAVSQQSAAASSATITRSIAISPKDQTAAASAKAIQGHPYATRTAASGASGAKAAVVYPGDLKYFGGAVLPTATSFNIFINSGPGPFGGPNNFEARLGASYMIHLTDEYVGTTADNRYTAGGNFTLKYPVVTTLGDNDLLLMIHAAGAGIAGGGYKNIYHIFLPPGTNYCGTGTLLPIGYCNASATSPNPAFCAFHGSVVFGDIGETLYTVEPYQDVDYCGVNNATSNPNAPTPNGRQNDSTYSTLSHETFETITDPDPGQGWYDNNIGVHGEIGDLCAYIPATTFLDHKLYRLQLEYSNAQHGCANQGK